MATVAPTGGVTMLPDPFRLIIVMLGKCSVTVVVSPLLSRMEDQRSKIESITCSAMRL